MAAVLLRPCAWQCRLPFSFAYVCMPALDTRQQAIDAAFEVIAEWGVQGATYRRIAAQAQLSPGTLTYHFPTIDDLLLAAFRQFADSISQGFEERMQTAHSLEQACEAVVDLICGQVWPTTAHLLLSFELYAMAARRADYRAVMHQWMAQSQAALRLQFAPDTARLLDATIEGLTIHNILGAEPTPRALILAHITAMGAPGYVGAMADSGAVPPMPPMGA